MKSANKLDALQEKMRRDKERLKPLNFNDFLKGLQTRAEHNGVCRCGRNLPWYRPHCPSCGSANVNGLARITVDRILPNGLTVTAWGFKCMRCRYKFHDVDTFLYCEAPPETETMRAVRQRQQVQETLQAHGFKDAEDFKKRLQEFRLNKAKAKGGVQ